MFTLVQVFCIPHYNSRLVLNANSKLFFVFTFCYILTCLPQKRKKKKKIHTHSLSFRDAVIRSYFFYQPFLYFEILHSLCFFLSTPTADKSLACIVQPTSLGSNNNVYPSVSGKKRNSSQLQLVKAGNLCEKMYTFQTYPGQHLFLINIFRL